MLRTNERVKQWIFFSVCLKGTPEAWPIFSLCSPESLTRVQSERCHSKCCTKRPPGCRQIHKVTFKCPHPLHPFALVCVFESEGAVRSCERRLLMGPMKPFWCLPDRCVFALSVASENGRWEGGAVGVRGVLFWIIHWLVFDFYSPLHMLELCRGYCVCPSLRGSAVLSFFNLKVVGLSSSENTHCYLLRCQ